jgi:hypothetical protein
MKNQLFSGNSWTISSTSSSKNPPENTNFGSGFPYYSSKSRWTCQFCSKTLSSKRSYDEHMNVHNDSRPFACEFCNYAAGM